jgi:hypothetical protein
MARWGDGRPLAVRKDRSEGADFLESKVTDCLARTVPAGGLLHVGV